MGGGESRSGMKIRGAARPVPVRVRPPAPRTITQVADGNHIAFRRKRPPWHPHAFRVDGKPRREVLSYTLTVVARRRHNLPRYKYKYRGGWKTMTSGHD